MIESRAAHRQINALNALATANTDGAQMAVRTLADAYIRCLAKLPSRLWMSRQTHSEGETAMTGQGRGLRLSAVVMSTALLVMAPMVGQALPPPSSTTLSQGTSCPIWDPTGNLTIPIDIPGLGSGTVSLTLTANEKGQISGTGTLAASGVDPYGVLGFIVLDGFDPNVRGKIKGSGGAVTVKLKSKMSGSATGSGFVLPVTTKLKFKGDVDPVGDAQGIGKLSIKVIKAVKVSGPFDFSIAAGAGNDGSWDLNLATTSPDGQALQVMGDLDLSTGRTISNINGAGKYNAGDDSSKLKIKGLGGASFKFKSLLADAGTIIGGLMSQKVLGQKRTLVLGPGVCP